MVNFWFRLSPYLEFTDAAQGRETPTASERATGLLGTAEGRSLEVASNSDAIHEIAAVLRWLESWPQNELLHVAQQSSHLVGITSSRHNSWTNASFRTLGRRAGIPPMIALTQISRFGRSAFERSPSPCPNAAGQK
jgi:hypothetical protein